jgi:hypothetical protein
MKKIAIIRAELAKDINASSKIVAVAANCQPQYVNIIRRKIKADLASPPVKKTKPKKRVPKIDYAKGVDNVGIASLNPFEKLVPEKKSENINYYLIISAIVLVTAVLIYVATQ